MDQSDQFAIQWFEIFLLEQGFEHPLVDSGGLDAMAMECGSDKRSGWFFRA